MPDTTRPSLLLRLRDPEDLDAWSLFERRYGPLIVSYAIARGVGFADAEDVRQSVLLGFSRRAPSFEYDRGHGRFRSYLGASVRNAVSRIKARHASSPNGLDDLGGEASFADDDHATDELWERQWMRHHYRLALATHRTTASPESVRVMEGFLRGLSTKQIAGELAMTEASVRKVKQRTKDALKSIIEEQLRYEDDGPHQRNT